MRGGGVLPSESFRRGRFRVSVDGKSSPRTYGPIAARTPSRDCQCVRPSFTKAARFERLTQEPRCAGAERGPQP
jgi:hypothetical protein